MQYHYSSLAWSLDLTEFVNIDGDLCSDSRELSIA